MTPAQAAPLLVFGVLIAVHELGHFLAAKACGVRVNEFAIGMGPALLKKTKGDTQYSLRLLPIGGFCAMEGEEEDSDDPAALNNQGFWQKLLIFAAGAYFVIRVSNFCQLMPMLANEGAMFLTGIKKFKKAKT